MLKNLSTYFFALLMLLSFGLQAEDDSWSNVFKFQTKMAEMGNVRAQFILGEMYEEGRGVKKNLVKAIEWYSKAESNGDSNAAIRISKIKKDIAQEKLNKKLSAKKQAKPKKKKTIKTSTKKKNSAKSQKAKPKQAPKKVQKPKIKKKPVVTKKKPIATPIEEIKVVAPEASKEVRKNASPEDFSRGAGTHLDDIEDPFD